MSKLFLFGDSFEKIATGVNTGIFDLLHTGVALLSEVGNFLYCNKAFIDMFGFSNDVIGKNVTEIFVTGEHGVMSVIRTQQPVISSSLTINNEKGISFRYPVKDDSGKLRGVVIESIPVSLGRDKLQMLMDTLHNLEKVAQHFEQSRSKQVGRLFTFADIIGESKALMEMKHLGQRFAASHEPILLWGESGSGKELVAQALHMASLRADHPFVTVNCAALPPELIESELFGYDAGAFTGARADGLIGKFEMANGGTIFLDEIGELPLSIQVKLLRVLESGEIQKIAHRGRLYSDFRLIGATNRTLPQMVREGKFREDLYHRLNVLEIYIPPLRERLEDLPLLMRYFIEQSVGGTKAKEIRVDQEVYRLFNLHSWPGNIRELKNVLTYALYSISENNILTKELLPTRFINAIQPPSLPQSHTDTVPAKTTPVWANDINVDLYEVTSDAERNLIKQALKKCRYNKSSVAKKLGISRNKLYRKLHEYGLLEASADDE